ncbi:MAG: hypothetical protein C0478_02660, partial [Planctomyces sp.]|nr:hypothetical protein [Planctomyces sp.]
MQPTIDQPFKFKFQFSDQNGNATSVFSLKGSFDGQALQLDKESLVIAGLLNVVRRQNRMVLTGIRDEGEVVQFILILSSKGVAAQLKQAVDIARSAHWAKVHREQLVAAGRGSSYRDATCPHCTATIILSDLPVTPQLFCPFCEALTTVAASAEPPANEKEFRLCDECGMFSHPQKFTIFYFYFLLVVYGFWTNEKWCCRACMRKDAWKMLAGNFLFVLGVPVAITQLIRAYSGSY